ncbi:TRAFAC clade GTPase domain-containing protein [Spirulina subsalsa]|uniref:TRAFAC clade GTPase domain-containing protein n=1 Tax=Spirulina subsalsa TaxID=54311 RepID=UPI00031F3357|nr:hypothetical protein [Spirulina subsalsa]
MKSFWPFNSEENLPTLNVAMLGPRGVGKTSLLAAMYDQFANVSQDLQLEADDESKSDLNKRLQELKTVGDSIKYRPSFTQTKGYRSFKFWFGQTGTNPALQINFQDYPGGWLEEDSQQKKVEDLIRQSVAVLIPIDTPILMEGEGKYHDKLNQPTEINDLFKKVYKDLDSPRLVILAPIKCEKYIKDDPSELFRKVREGYQKLLNQFASEKLVSKVSVIITPVQTLGGVVFSRIEFDNNGEPTFFYRKPQPNSLYKPKNTEVPLRYLLRFLLKLHLDNGRASIFKKIWNVLGRNSGLRNAVSRFTEPRPDEVEIVQGLELLKL